MNFRIYLYTAVISAVALATAVIAIALDPTIPDLAGLAGWAVFVGLGLLAERMAVTFAAAAKPVKSSVLFLPLFASAVSFPPWMVICAVLIIVPVVERFFVRPVLWRAAFNTAQITISFGLAAVVYHAVSGGTINELGGSNIAAFMMMVGTNLILNTVLVVGFISVQQKQPFPRMFRNAVGPAAGNLLYDFLASPIALVVAILYQQMYIKGVILILLPLYLIRYAYISKSQLQTANNDLLRVLVIAIETRDPYTSGHSQRVSALAAKIAEDLGLSDRTVKSIERAALLHDIGKIDAVYAPIISKPHDLTADEQALIRTHATRGADLLESLSLLDKGIVAAVRHHHERWDGKGYPDGLADVDVPLAARIIMVSDSIDAMLSDRPYRAALTIEETESELRRCAGTQFDPAIVKVIIARGTLQNARSFIENPEFAAPLPGMTV